MILSTITSSQLTADSTTQRPFDSVARTARAWFLYFAVTLSIAFQCKDFLQKNAAGERGGGGSAWKHVPGGPQLHAIYSAEIVPHRARAFGRPGGVRGRRSRHF